MTSQSIPAKAMLALLSTLLVGPALASPLLTRRQIHQSASSWLLADVDALAAKESINGLEFKHPSLVEHSLMQSYRYHEVYVERQSDGVTREWEVLGGGIDFHYLPATQKWSTQKNIQRWTRLPDFSRLLPESSLAARAAQALKLEAPLSSADFVVKHKILPANGTARVLYWIEIKARAFASDRASPRTLALDAETGATVFNFSRNHHATSTLAPVIVRSGQTHIAKSKKSSDVELGEDFNQKFKDYCQVISSHKDSLGDPLLINPLKCDVVIENDQHKGNPDNSAKRAAENTKKILGYYNSRFSQFGYDNNPTKNTPITSIVHIGDHYDNAYWDEELEVLAYGDGAGGSERGSTRDYTLALDIAGHEFTHAIVSHTAKFTATSDAGALNEGFADIFGVFIARSQNKRHGWTIGANLFNNADGDSDEIALRSLSNPEKYKTSTLRNGKSLEVPYPQKYSERLAADDKTCDEENDQCEVHANSTIWSRNAYLIDSVFQASGMSADEADQATGNLFFLTLTHRLHENSTFKQAAQEVLATCQELLTPAQCNLVQSAFVRTELME